MLPVSTYTANKGCEEMLQRISEPSALDTLNIKLRADQILEENRSDEFRNKLAHCLKNRLPFILYEDDTKFNHGNYYVIIPGTMKMLCYMGRQLKSETTSTTVNAFANNVHLAIAAYNKIWMPQGKIESKIILLT